MDLQKLSEQAARALEDHKLIAYEAQGKAADIIKVIMGHGIKRMVEDFYDG